MKTKFKAWHKIEKYLGDVDIVDFKNRQVNIVGADIAKFEEVELMQWLGWNDDSDVEIFGGYIARIWWSDPVGESHSELFSISNPDEMMPEEMLFLANLDAIEVVGNIYENPELLKVR